MFAVDSSEVSKNALKDSIEHLDLSDKEIYLVTVFENPDYLFLEGNIDSSWVLDIEKKNPNDPQLYKNPMPPVYLKKSNGADVYDTTDIARIYQRNIKKEKI